MLSENFIARNLVELPPIPIGLALPFTQRKENIAVNIRNQTKKNISLILNPAFVKKYSSIRMEGINTIKVPFRCFFMGIPPLK
jgi:hypothetical protein